MKTKSLITLTVAIFMIFQSCQEKKKPVFLTENEIQKTMTYSTLEDLQKANPDSVLKINLDNRGLKEIPAIVYTFPNLKELSLKGNEIESIQPDIKRLENLQAFDLSTNSMDRNKSFDQMRLVELAFVYKNNGETEQYEKIINDTEHLTATIAEEINADCATGWGRVIPPWEYSRTEIGFIPKKNAGDPDLIEVKSASDISPDLTLRDELLNINLAYLVCYDYPGKGQHDAFFGYNAAPIGPSSKINDKDFSFNQNFIVNESDEPALKSIPIFNGLGSGTEGVIMNCVIYNVSNKNDQKVAQVFESGKKGLDILNVATPAISIVSSIADEALRIIRSNHNNIEIHNVKLGLHFNDNGTDLQLRQGTYIAMNVPKCIDGQLFEFDWSNYEFNRTNGKLKGKGNTSIKQNYIVFTVTKK